ncbi:haloacid dehalogenase type II [Oricola cellulosilytica]|uniref:(S)-2-haloacid dehalogenase n=1 Tax=Oricola cellulosilytica TaxID=1429082 RepID=A0A4R0PD05_9HYPH|nr:haloacid dehalogenase type II [Oricola cellulosilytica]TCD14085.1 haloacid dehalogenase type II [Oricola cellulosilytica]
MPSPQALFFDVFGTCVDWRSAVEALVSQMVREKGCQIDSFAFADAWRARYQPAMQEIRAGRRSYADLDVLHRENLDATLREFGLTDRFDVHDRADLNKAWEKLTPWPDTVAGLSRLKSRFIIAPCSNGSIALMTRLSKFGNLPWDCILGAGLARAYKPDPQAYLRSCAALQLDPAEVMMVAAHNDDLAAARNAGLQTCFIPRTIEYGPDQTTDLRAESDWEIVARDLEDLALHLAC